MLVAARAIDRERRDGDSPQDRLHVAIEAIESAFAVRSEILGADPDELMGHEVAVDRSRAQRRGGPTKQAHTTALAVSDIDGNVVSMTASLFDEFGCATLVPEGGFFLNDRMLGFDRDTDSPNRARPSAWPLSTLSPALVDDGDRVLAIATPGADGQVQTLTQVLEGVFIDGMSVLGALDRPRWRSMDGQLLLEQGFDLSLAQGLTARGHEIEWLPGRHETFGAAVVAGFDRGGSNVFASDDNRRQNAAAVW